MPTTPGEASDLPPGLLENGRAAVREAPLDGRGYRLLAQQAELSGDPTTAEMLYDLAATRGPRDIPSLNWLINRALARQDYARAFADIDKILRVQPELNFQLYKLLITLLDKAPVQEEFAALMRKQPPWREDFLPRLIRQSDNSAALFNLIESLRLSPPGLSEGELSTWIDRLATDRQWAAAYLIWAQSLPAEARAHIGNVFDGGFDREPSNQGFDWRFKDLPGASISREQLNDASSNDALRVEFGDTRVPFQNVRQLLALAPGKYQLSGKVRLDDLRSERGLVWTLSCAEGGQVIGETEPMAGHHPWSRFIVGFTVPASGCNGQWLTLRIPARIPAEQLIGGVAWFDDLEVQATPGRP